MRKGINKAEKIKKEVPIFFLLSSVLILADRVLKILFFKTKPNMQFNIAGITVLSIKTIENYGAAFGILSNNQTLLIIVPIIIIAFILINLNKILSNSKYKIPSFLIFSGAVGNLIDRVFYGKVIDFISILSIPYFNLADAMISTGVFIIVFMEVLPLKPKQSLNKSLKK